MLLLRLVSGLSCLSLIVLAMPHANEHTSKHDANDHGHRKHQHHKLSSPKTGPKSDHSGPKGTPKVPSITSPSEKSGESQPAKGKKAEQTLQIGSAHVVLKEPYIVKPGEVYDGKMKTYDRGRKCDNQSETGDSEAVFLVMEGATLKNVIIGPNQSQGVRCPHGHCTIDHVIFPNICEDAVTIKGDSGTSLITHSEFNHAIDKAIQMNGCDELIISDTKFANCSKGVRSCGDCVNNGKSCPRKITVQNSWGHSVGTFLAVNTNFGDTAALLNNVYDNVGKVCENYDAVVGRLKSPKDRGVCGDNVRIL